MTLYETTAKPSTNASLSFWKDNRHRVHTLWVETLAQPHQVNGTRVQSSHTAHWYPKSYAPGDISVTVRCRSQEDLQHLANYIRLHHKLLMETPGLRFSSKAGSLGNRHLMLLRIPSEAIAVRGWVPTFTLTKKGVFEPAPQVTFPFFAAIDPYSSDPIVSHQIREWWNAKKMKPVNLDEFDPEGNRPDIVDNRPVTRVQGRVIGD